MKCRTCGTTLSAGALLCGECGTSAIAPRPTLGETARYDRQALLEGLTAEAERRAPASPDSWPTQPSTAEPAPAAAAPAPAAAASPATPAPPAPAPPSAEPAVFTLVFSTGESIRVSGAGLVGRNPLPAEGERLDYLVQLIDPRRTVSKTHLAFGVELDTGDGSHLWVADRDSSNGTRVVAPADPSDADRRLRAAELQPGARVRVPRGSRVGIGDEWFDVR